MRRCTSSLAWYKLSVPRPPARRLLSLRVLLAVILVALSSENQVFAYGWRTCLGDIIKWRSNSTTMRASTVSFPSGSDDYDGLLDGIHGINRNPSRFRVHLTSDTGGVAFGNRSNEVWYSSDQSDLDGAPAIAYSRWTCYWLFGNRVYLTEGDVLFDVSRRWSNSHIKQHLYHYGGGNRLLAGTAAHEFGHVLGLLHENRRYNIMGDDRTHMHVNGRIARTYAGVDAGNGAEHLYGTRSDSWEDLGVAHWKYDRADGEYSKHRRTELFTASGGRLRQTRVGDETGYLVTPGQVVRAEFMFENNGKSAASVNVGYYISTNDIISTFDRRVGGGRYGFPHNTLGTATARVRIPSDLAVDRNYWLGIIVDEDDAIDERIEWNNATYIPLKTFSHAPRDDHGNDRSTATIVRAPSSTAGRLETGGDVDWFGFALTEASRLAGANHGQHGYRGDAVSGRHQG